MVPSFSAGCAEPPPPAGDASPCWRPVPWVPDLLALHRLNSGRYPFLLESAARGPWTTARHDLLLAFPGERLRLRHPGEGVPFLEALDRWWRREARAAPSGLPWPFAGGWFLYLGYELAGEVEPRLLPRLRRGRLPAALAVRVRAAVVRDHRTRRCWLVAEPGQEACLEAMAADLEASAALPAPGPVPPLRWSEDPPERFLGGVRRVLRYIRDGDVFQVNLSRGWRAGLPPALARDPAPLYARLREANPAPFAGLARLDDEAGGEGEGAWILSSSPERLLRLEGDRAETRPIAGTRPRGRGAEDARLSRELLAHPKERAEHVMLIDLERNDLGRICRPGTVRVEELMVLESYAHVHHIVSGVVGRLRPGVGPGEAVRALFPGGTITGCPKVRCMEIIAELEGCPRGAYTGAMGYLGLDGRLDLNILIRSLELVGGELVLRAGAGIVADSDPERELAETRAKARGLLLALDPGLDPRYGVLP